MMVHAKNHIIQQARRNVKSCAAKSKQRLEGVFLNTSIQSLEKNLMSRLHDFRPSLPKNRTAMMEGNQNVSRKRSLTYFSAQSIVRNLANELGERTHNEIITANKYETPHEANEKVLNSFYNDRGLRPHFQTKKPTPLQATMTSSQELPLLLEKSDVFRHTAGLTRFREKHPSLTTIDGQHGKKDSLPTIDLTTFSDYMASCKLGRKANTSLSTKNKFNFRKIDNKEAESYMAGDNLHQNAQISPKVFSQSMPIPQTTAHMCESQVSSHSFWTNLTDLESKKTFKPARQNHSKLTSFFNFINPLGKKQKKEDNQRTLDSKELARSISNWSLENIDSKREPFYLEAQSGGGRKWNKIDRLKKFFNTKKNSDELKDSAYMDGNVFSGNDRERYEVCNDDDSISKFTENSSITSHDEATNIRGACRTTSGRSFSSDSLDFMQNNRNFHSYLQKSQSENRRQLSFDIKGKPTSNSSGIILSAVRQENVNKVIDIECSSTQDFTRTLTHDVQRKSEANLSRENVQSAHIDSKEVNLCQPLLKSCSSVDRNKSEFESSYSISGDSESWPIIVEYCSQNNHVIAEKKTSSTRQENVFEMSYGYDWPSETENNQPPIKYDIPGKTSVIATASDCEQPERKHRQIYTRVTNSTASQEITHSNSNSRTTENIKRFCPDESTGAFNVTKSDTSTPPGCTYQAIEIPVPTGKYCIPPIPPTKWPTMKQSKIGYATVDYDNRPRISSDAASIFLKDQYREDLYKTSQVEQPQGDIFRVGLKLTKRPRSESSYVSSTVSVSPRGNNNNIMLITPERSFRPSCDNTRDYQNVKQPCWQSVVRSGCCKKELNFVDVRINNFKIPTPLSSCPSVASLNKPVKTKTRGILGIIKNRTMPTQFSDDDSISRKSIKIGDKIPNYSRFAPRYREWLVSRKSKARTASGTSKTLSPEVVEQIRKLVALPVEVQQQLMKNLKMKESICRNLR